jgi:hypothetical protein
VKSNARRKSSNSTNAKPVKRKDGSRLTLAPLTTEEAIVALFAAKPQKRSGAKKLRGTS